MANNKLTDLNELTTPADGDKLYIVDVSDTTDDASGSSKFITKTNLFSGIVTASSTTTFTAPPAAPRRAPTL